MGALNISDTIARIRIATKESPIVCFQGSKSGTIDSRFAATVKSQFDIERRATDTGRKLIGVFSRDDLEIEVRRVLERNI